MTKLRGQANSLCATELPMSAFKVELCKFYNKYMIASSKITITEFFAFIALLVFKLLSRKVLFIKRKDKKNC